ncbi:origin recognition complex subunit 5 C-terminus-domain-containing protein [Panaeolus papilionaceus]|nr:origin recognition complex subunit 5 C-terminus-domain-containing protein [Panaeolus papilionaceus]
MTYIIPGYDGFCNELSTLISTSPPPFIYIHDQQSMPVTCRVTDALLNDASFGESSTKVKHARVDGISCFTTRLFYETVINSLIGHRADWDEGCSNWTPEEDLGIRWNENLDTFLHGLRAVHQHLCKQNDASTLLLVTSDKGKEQQSRYDNVRLVIVVEHVERLRDNLPELIVPLTRLAELARIDVCVVFISQVGWQDIRPSFGASPDPYYVDVCPPAKENIVKTLVGNFSELSKRWDETRNPYHPALQSLYSHFITFLCDVCFPFTHDQQELQYIAAARWPGFVKPTLDKYNSHDEDEMETQAIITPPTEEIRMRLSKLFNPSLTSALEALLPRQTNATEWSLANEPPPNLLSLTPAHAAQAITKTKTEKYSAPESAAGMKDLPKMCKYIILASFLASTNPAKSDLRMFGRGLDDKKRKRRVHKQSGKAKANAGPAKIPQRLVGPSPFPMDRMVAILGALLEENDADTWIGSMEFMIPGEQTDLETMKVGVMADVMELTSMRLLHRTSPVDRLDGPPMFKCVVSYEECLALAKQLDVALNDLLWDPL